MKNYEEMYEQQTAWEEATERYAISAREYFYILKLAIYHVDGVKTDSSYEITQHVKSADVYECALDILNAMYERSK